MPPDVPDLVFDTSPLSFFSRVGALHLLESRFAGRARIPSEVRLELFEGAQKYRELRVAVQVGWLQENPLQDLEDLLLMDQLLKRYWVGEQERHRAEVAAIVLAKKLGAIAVLDEKLARTAAEDLGVPIIGTVGLLADFVVHTILQLDAAWELHEKMRALNPAFRSPISERQQFVQEVLRRRALR